MAKSRKVACGTQPPSLARQLAEARAQQAATAEILRVISRSPADIQPVCDAIAERAMKLCDAMFGVVARFDGEKVDLVSIHGVSRKAINAIRAIYPLAPSGKTVTARSIRDRAPAQIPDVLADREYAQKKVARAVGYRGIISVPLLRGKQVVGAIAVARAQAGAYSTREIALLKTFADQAVIAIQNARLFHETKEALEHQTATAEVLQVISSSVADTTPVFNKILRSCQSLFDNSVVTLGLVGDDGMMHLRQDPEALDHPDKRLRRGARSVQAAFPRPVRDSIYGYAMHKRQVLHYPDVLNGPGVPKGLRKSTELVGSNYSALYAPLLWEDGGIGALNVSRFPPQPFSDREIRLLKTFADQAVIAIQNARLFNETKEALERQTATAEILKVIAASPSDVRPVFEAIAASAKRLTGAHNATVLRVEADVVSLGAFTSLDAEADKALQMQYPHPVGRFERFEQMLRARTAVQVVDSELEQDATLREIARIRGWRSLLVVPLLRQGEVIGTINVGRKEPGAFAEHQIGVVRAFADQAVIAIHNARLFNETREALERQTAISEILRVISDSPSDVTPVLDAVAERAARICEARVVDIILAEGGTMRVGATVGELGRPVGEAVPLDRTTVMGRSIVDRASVHVADLIGAGEEFPRGRELALKYGHRTILAVPLLREGRALGTILVRRAEVRPFDDKHIALLKTFADQAAIAIENVRLFNETREALERQTATAEILKVIAGSPTDVQPVFEAIAQSAHRLFSRSAAFQIVRDGALHIGAIAGFSAAGLEKAASLYPMPLEESRRGLRALREGTVLETTDVQAEGTPSAIAAIASAAGFRSIVTVPLMRGESLVGQLSLTAEEVRPRLDDKQLGLLKTFADQAVIAIENVRLFNETQEALQRQTATSEILRVISSTPSDTQPVFEAIVNSTQRLMAGKSTVLLLRRDPHFVVGAYAGPAVANLPEDVRVAPLDPEKNFPSRAILGGEIVHIPDWEGDDIPEHERTVGKSFGIKSGLMVPLLREGKGIGAIAVTRGTPGLYHEKEIALLRSFADQAVIAIENSRLFNETKEALERQTATGEILKVISTSMADTRPVFEKIIQSCQRLFRSGHAGIALIGDDGLMHLIQGAATLNSADERVRTVAQRIQAEFPRPVRDSIHGYAIHKGKVLHYPDVQHGADVPKGLRRSSELVGNHSVLFAPMLWEGKGIGVVQVVRNPPEPFTDEDISLLKTFADQAVIAIQNARLFNETKEALEQQKASAEILRVISSSVEDTKPVFEAIAEACERLFEGRYIGINLIDENGGLLLAASRYPAGQERELEALVRHFEMAPTRTSGTRLKLRGALIDFPDVESGPDVPEEVRDACRVSSTRAITFAPMVSAGKGIGSIWLARAAATPLSDKDKALLKTFADQAVIAIQNARLFHETKEALERQTATAEILKVISSSPTDVQPVLDAIVQSAMRLFEPWNAAIVMRDGNLIRLGAVASPRKVSLEEVSKIFPLPFDPEKVDLARVIVERRVREIMDAQGPETSDLGRRIARAGPYRSAVAVPLVRDNEGIGAIVLSHPKSGVRLTDKQLALIQTFADQAVIAIQNVRLFNETKESLERQTATAEVLKVISSSPTDLQPVFDAILERALRLCEAHLGFLGLYDGEKYEHVAHRGVSGEYAKWIPRGPFVPDPRMTIGRVLREGKSIHHHDLRESRAYLEGVEAVVKTAEMAGARTLLAVPMLKDARIVGCIAIYRPEVRPFAAKQIDLLGTFASQAVIAIENVRLFKELKARTEALTKSVGQLTALGEVGQAISSTLDLEIVLKTIVNRAMQLTALDAGVIYEYDESTGKFELRASENFDDESVAGLRGAGLRKGEGAVGTSVATREPVQVHDIHAPDYPARLRGLLDRSGFRAILAVPLLREDQTIGALMMLRKAPGEFAPDIVDMLKTFASQSALAIQNARLFREIAEKGRQLEEASKHKSQFLASMSHELRTPLNAILGFNEMILAQVYGEVPEAMKEPLTDVQTSGKHLLRLINNVLDLAKIEAGRMELAPADYSVQDTVESVRITLRPLAAEKGLEFLATVPADIPLAYGDQGRITQCLMNIAGNSLKFTKAGKVEISVEQHDGILQFRVADTGIGIPPDKIGSLFQEFRQTDATIASEFGGSGLGLSITKKFIEMHGGRIWVESELGKGSTFIFEIPLRVAQ